MRVTSKINILQPMAVAMFAFSGVAMAKTVNLTGSFTTEGMAKTTPSGTVQATLDTSTNLLKYTITYSGLSGPVKAAHFHGPATASQQAKVLVPIPGPYSSGMTGTEKVSKTIEKDLEAGKTYVNLHTATNPEGEARAQMMESK